MKKIKSMLCAAIAAAGCASSALAVGNVVIAEAFTGGASGGATYKNDYVVLFNRTSTLVDMSTWSLQYASSTGTTWTKLNLTGSIQPGGYYLVQLGGGASGLDLPITPDQSSTSISMQANNAKLALVNNTTTLSGTCPTGSMIVDFLGYGTASCAEGTNAPAGTITTSLIRAAGGCTDTDVNSADFSNGTPTPRNSASPTNSCTFTTGACCTGTACNVVNGTGACSGTYLGDGTTCSPNPCGGACCTSTDTNCQFLTQTACSTLGGTWSVGQACSPTFCFGACCSGSTCLQTSQQGCSGTWTAGFTCLPTSCTTTPGNIVIAEVFGGGGNSGAPYNADYVVLFNRTQSNQEMNGWSIQYASQTGSNWTKVGPIAGIIPPGGYYLVQVSGTGANGAALPAPNFSATTISASASNGKFALVRNDSVIASGVSCPITDASASGVIEDFVQYGVAGASGVCGEGGAPTGTSTDNTLAAVRLSDGCVDSNNNAADFVVSAPNPRNSSSPVNLCGTSGGACCTGLTCNVVANVGACSGTYIGDLSTCSPNNPCLPETGSCCIAASTVCQVLSEADCTTQSGDWTLGGTCTPSTLCEGACCVGTSCTVTSSLGCANGFWTAGGVCTPTFCPSEVAVQAGDVVYGANTGNNFDTAPQVRDAAGVGTRVGTWGQFDFIQTPRFDNANGGNHNPQGNLLGLNFGVTPGTTPGSGVGGAVLSNFSTNGTGTAQFLFQLNDTNTFGLQASRGTGMSVSPDNTKVALIGTDAARVYVLNYNAGSSVGTGAGASITGGNQSDNSSFLFTPAQTSGTVWLDNSTLVVYVNAADPFGANGPALFTFPVDSAGVLGAPTYRLNTTVTGFTGAARFYAIAYNSAISPYIFAMASDFNSTSSVWTNRLSVIDPASWTEVRSLDMSTSLETGREIALGGDRNLYISQFAGSSALATSALVDRLDLDTDNDNDIDATDIAALSDNSSTNWYVKATGQSTSSFNGLDVAVSIGVQNGACCLANGVCSITTPAVCSFSGTFQGLGTLCDPNPCQQPSVGRCCVGSRCTTAASLTACNALDTGAAGAVFFSGVSNCNVAGNSSAPCCFADFNKVGGITVQDIFDFLADWFAGNVNANVAGDGVATPTVQDIFDFLAAWFAGGC